MESANDTATIKPRRWLGILGLLGSLIFVVAATFLTISDGKGDPILWTCLIVFGSTAILFLLALLPGASYLRLDRSGFIVCELFHRRYYRWHDIGRFTVGRLICIPRQVGFSTPESEELFSRMGPRRRHWLRLIAGDHQLLLGSFGMPAMELAATMNRWRDEAIRHAATGPEPPPQWPLRRRQHVFLAVTLAIMWVYIAGVAAAFYLQFCSGR